MNCMKCGREIGEDQVFCPKCQELMAQHPVKGDIVVQLPLRKESMQKKPLTRKRTPTPEEQILQLKRKNRWLTAFVVLLIAACLTLAYLTVDYMGKLGVQQFRGQNYSTVETSD